MTTTLKHFFIPERHAHSFFDFFAVQACAIIPTYKPGNLTLRLVEDLLKWNPTIQIYVVDDCTPTEYQEATEIFEKIRALPERVTLLRTPTNKLKAGALNFALKYLKDHKEEYWPEAIITLDDDVVVNKTTIRNLVIELLGHPNLGAVCSQSLVFNKNKNLLTRLQSLEYQGFNATRLADEGFYGGPLVMHGMLTAFRSEALVAVSGFTEKHLIEDYEITTRLKIAGFHVKSAIAALAWTEVPENLVDLWKQRTRWTFGGMVVVANTKKLSVVMQDCIGHGFFITTILMIDLLLFSQGGTASPIITRFIVTISFLQFFIWYVFQLWLMRLYKEKDLRDWIIRISLVPEFVYSNILTTTLIGSYLFFVFTIFANRITEKSNATLQRLVASGRKVFLSIGYTEGWGTRSG